jgi:ubiquitin C-terminal hydrolase
MIILIDELSEKYQNIFKNVFYSILKCKKCNSERKIEEKLNIWSLTLKEHINDSFKDFFSREILEDKVYCNKCNKKENFIKYYKIKKLSNSLIIHLKRFNNKLIKNNNDIYVNDIIRLENDEYELRGVIIHSGNCKSGHYYFIGKDLSNIWYRYNDNYYNIEKNLNIFKKGYMFYYEKI